MSNQMVFLGTSGVGVYSLIKYEITKYYVYIKYENLVNV